MSYDYVSTFNPNAIPSKSQVGVVSGDVAEEGTKVILSNGDQVAWAPPPERLAVPDLSQIKSLRKYFGKSGFEAFPAWVYHPELPARIIKNNEEGLQLGIFFRKTTADEKSKLRGVEHIWDWNEDCQWRPDPFPKDVKFDPHKAHHGKEIQFPRADPMLAQNSLLAALTDALKNQKGGISGEDLIAALGAIMKGNNASAPAPNAFEVEDPKLSDDQELSMWREEAESRGIKIDKRWGVSRLKEEVEKAAQAD